MDEEKSSQERMEEEQGYFLHNSSPSSYSSEDISSTSQLPSSTMIQDAELIRAIINNHLVSFILLNVYHKVEA